MWQTYKIQYIPVSFFITRQGEIFVKRLGPMDKDLIDRYLSKLL